MLSCSMVWLLLLAACSAYAEAAPQNPLKPRLCIKIPTATRPVAFLTTLKKYYENLSGETDYHFIVSCDAHDTTMNNDKIKKQLAEFPHLTVRFSNNRSKIEAFNDGITKETPFDVLLVASDDMIPVVKGFDKIIVDYLQGFFPDFDGVLNLNDGHVGAECNTIPVIGKKFFDRCGYVFNPAYHALFCDEELAEVAKKLKKERVVNEVLITHAHPLFSGRPWDALYQKNEALHSVDKATFQQRKARNFDIDALEMPTKKLWSILICTLNERTAVFTRLYHKLQKQIADAGLCDSVEVLFFRDNRTYSIGTKRNALLQQSQAEYTCFLDDDDDVHEKYVEMIVEKLQEKPDCVSLVGIITQDGKHPEKFVHSLKYNKYFKQDGVFYRPPNHLNPIKRDIAVNFLFPEKNWWEDNDWAMSLVHAHALKTEAVIEEPYYFYLYTTK